MAAERQVVEVTSKTKPAFSLQPAASAEQGVWRTLLSPRLSFPPFLETPSVESFLQALLSLFRRDK